MTTPLVTPDQRERIRTALRNAPSQMTLQVARNLDVPEAAVIREMPDGRATELDPGRVTDILTALEPVGDVTVIVSNASVTCEVTGRFGGFSTWGEFFNVQTGSLDLHIRPAELAHVFAVVKPSHMDGGRTLSVQFYDTLGNSALKAFFNFGGSPSAERAAQWEELRERFRRPG